MIKFFRRIRQNLLSEGKTGKYLKYAIGEIVLVVIGILIALQLNNWNENRKKTVNFEKLINSFKEEIRINIMNANNIIRRNYQADSVMQLILKPKKDAKVFIEDDRLKFWISFYTSTIRFSDENLNLLLNQKEDFPSKYEFLIQDIVLLKELIESQKKWENIVMDLVNDVSNYNDLNLPWLNKNDSLSIAKKKDYIFNNPFYHNQLLTFAEIQLDENVYDMNNVRLVSLRLLNDIEDLQNGLNTSNKAEFFKKLEFNNFPKFICNDSIAPLSNKADIRMTIGIFNTLKDTVRLKLANENGGKIGIEINIPSNYMYILFRDINEGILFIQEQDGACIAKFQNRRNSVLIIE